MSVQTVVLVNRTVVGSLSDCSDLLVTMWNPFYFVWDVLVTVLTAPFFVLRLLDMHRLEIFMHLVFTLVSVCALTVVLVVYVCLTLLSYSEGYSAAKTKRPSLRPLLDMTPAAAAVCSPNCSEPHTHSRLSFGGRRKSSVSQGLHRKMKLTAILQDEHELDNDN